MAADDSRQQNTLVNLPTLVGEQLATPHVAPPLQAAADELLRDVGDGTVLELKGYRALQTRRLHSDTELPLWSRYYLGDKLPEEDPLVVRHRTEAERLIAGGVAELLALPRSSLKAMYRSIGSHEQKVRQSLTGELRGSLFRAGGVEAEGISLKELNVSAKIKEHVPAEVTPANHGETISTLERLVRTLQRLIGEARRFAQDQVEQLQQYLDTLRNLLAVLQAEWRRPAVDDVIDGVLDRVEVQQAVDQAVALDSYLFVEELAGRQQLATVIVPHLKSTALDTSYQQVWSRALQGEEEPLHESSPASDADHAETLRHPTPSEEEQA